MLPRLLGSEICKASWRIRCPAPWTQGQQRVLGTTTTTNLGSSFGSGQNGQSSELNASAAFSEWRPIYRLPLIRLVAAFNRLKIYQAVVTMAGTPLAFALSQAGQVSSDALGICGAIGVSGLITLTLGSYVATNLVGFIYINDQKDQLKLAYVDFWGRRQEIVLHPDDLLTNWEQETENKRFSFYQPISLRSNPKIRYKLLYRFGVVTDPELFEGLFGD
ncbi:transmembrane protein 186 [Drosophila tropicalis]|uniref:transmembrane protein 186 n=1 Tax=Drosophila tropicalis TaxID=46794 RepID=UPI0035AC2826